MPCHTLLYWTTSYHDGCSSKAAKQLQVAQNKALRAVLSVDSRYSTTSLHAETGVPYLQDSRKYHTLCFAHRGMHNLSSDSVNNSFVRGNRNRGLWSEDSPSFMVYRCKIVLGTRSLLQRCNNYWQPIPTVIKQSQSLDNFKSTVKEYLYDWYPHFMCVLLCSIWKLIYFWWLNTCIINFLCTYMSMHTDILHNYRFWHWISA